MAPPYGYYGDPNPAYGVPLYGSVPIPRGPSLFGVGSRPDGMLGGLAQSLVPMISELVRSKLGGFGFNFGSDMNIAQAEYSRQFMEQMNRARGAGAEADRGQIETLLRGANRMIGNQITGRTASGEVKFTEDIERGLPVMTKDLSMMLPMMAAMFPDTVDKLFPRGSMAVAAASFVNAGRFVVDPATGRPVSEDANYGVRVLQPLLDKGAAATSGLGAGRLGQTFEQLVNRGMLSSGADLRQAVETGLLSGDNAKDIQSSRVQEQLGRYSKVVAAINDIFAESGRSNAPMAELIRGLEHLTQGGMSSYSAGDLASITRVIHATAQTSGMGIEQLTQLSSMTGQMMRQFGAPAQLAATYAPYIAQSGRAYADLGYGMTPSPELADRDEFVKMQARNAAAGAGSDYANILANIMVSAQYVDPTSRFAKIARGIEQGQTVVDGFDVSRALPEDLYKMYADAGGNANNFMARLRDPNQLNAEKVRQAQALASGVQTAQRNEVDFDIRNVISGRADLAKDIADAGGTAAVLKALRDESAQPFVDSATFYKNTSKRLGRDDRFADSLSATLGNLFADTQYKSVPDALRATSPELQDTQRAMDLETRARAIKMDELTHLARGGFTRNITNWLAGTANADWTNPNAAISSSLGTAIDALASGLGMVKEIDAARAAQPQGLRSWDPTQLIDPETGYKWTDDKLPPLLAYGMAMSPAGSMLAGYLGPKFAPRSAMTPDKTGAAMAAMGAPFIAANMSPKQWRLFGFDLADRRLSDGDIDLDDSDFPLPDDLAPSPRAIDAAAAKAAAATQKEMEKVGWRPGENRWTNAPATATDLYDLVKAPQIALPAAEYGMLGWNLSAARSLKLPGLGDVIGDSKAEPALPKDKPGAPTAMTMTVSIGKLVVSGDKGTLTLSGEMSVGNGAGSASFPSVG